MNTGSLAGCYGIVNTPAGYVVVAPPVGIIVPVLPPGCTPVMVDEVTCHGLNCLYYQPVMVGGVVHYRTVVL